MRRIERLSASMLRVIPTTHILALRKTQSKAKSILKISPAAIPERTPAIQL
jgi:hypothetical protein